MKKNINNRQNYMRQQMSDISNEPEILSEFRKYKRIIQARSPLTVDEYAHDLMLFFRYIKAQRKGIAEDSDEFASLDVSDIDVDFLSSVDKGDIMEFLLYCSDDRENSSRTRARKLSSVKSLYKYLTVTKNYFEQNPAANIDTPQSKKSLPKYLTVEESVSLLKAVQDDSESKTKPRDYAIITLFLNCGMRLSELVGINISDIDPELRSLRVTGKGAKERVIYLNDACRTALFDYLTARAADCEIKDKNALFLSSRHSRISPKTVQWVIYKYLDAAGLGNRKFSTHKLRHTAATLMYQTGKVDVRVLKDILGHEQLNTTQIYTHVSDENMERAMEFNPLSEIKRKKDTLKKTDNDEGSNNE